MEPDDGIYIGHRHEWGGETPFCLDVRARRQHVYVIGQTGAGKSTLLRNCILQDIEAGRGVALIDPHGDLAADVLEEIPRRRTGDVVYLNAATRNLAALNLFHAAADNWHVVASGIVSAFKKIWGNSWGPRLEYVLYATLAALAQCRNTSLLGVTRMLQDPRYRAWVIKQVRDPMVRYFWEHEFAEYDSRFRQETIGPIQNKVGQIFLAPALRNVLGQVSSRIDFRFMMDGQRIFIANLNKALLGDAHSSLLGSLLVTGFELAAMSRSNVPHEKRTSFFLYADEFHHYATDSFATILSEARKYGLSLTIAHQYLDQLTDPLKAAVFGNVGTFCAFRVSEADGSVLERQYGGVFPRASFTNLENYQICVRMLNQDPFRATSLPPVQLNRKRRRVVIRHSRRRFSRKRKIVEERIEKWLRRVH